MRTQKYIKLHNRCVVILELMQKSDRYLHHVKNDLAKFRAKSRFDQGCEEMMGGGEGYYLKQINRYQCIKLRLVRFYADIMGRLNQEVFEWMDSRMPAEEENKILEEVIN